MVPFSCIWGYPTSKINKRPAFRTPVVEEGGKKCITLAKVLMLWISIGEFFHGMNELSHMTAYSFFSK